MQTMTETYNGWKNYPTWNVALWLDNDQGSQEQALELARRAMEEEHPRVDLADALKQIHEDVLEEIYPDFASGASVFNDLLGFALDSVDWFEVADHYLEQVAEES